MTDAALKSFNATNPLHVDKSWNSLTTHQGWVSQPRSRLCNASNKLWLATQRAAGLITIRPTARVGQFPWTPWWARHRLCNRPTTREGRRVRRQRWLVLCSMAIPHLAATVSIPCYSTNAPHTTTTHACTYFNPPPRLQTFWKKETKLTPTLFLPRPFFKKNNELSLSNLQKNDYD